MQKNIFRQSSIDKILSPQQLNDYIKISSPGVWLILFSFFILFVSLIFWSFKGKIPTIVSAKAVVVDSNILCFIPVEKSENIKTGMKVILNQDNSSFIKEVSDKPFSLEDSKKQINDDYVIYLLSPSEWNKKIVIENNYNFSEGTVCDLNIIIEENKPIDYILN